MIEAQKMKELELSHGRVVQVHCAKGDFAFRSLKRTEYKRVLNLLAEKGSKAEGIETAALYAVVFPSREVLDSALEDMPGIASEFLGPILELSGVEQAAAEKF
jgi:hypothetical protein